MSPHYDERQGRVAFESGSMEQASVKVAPLIPRLSGGSPRLTREYTLANLLKEIQHRSAVKPVDVALLLQISKIMTDTVAINRSFYNNLLKWCK